MGGTGARVLRGRGWLGPHTVVDRFAAYLYIQIALSDVKKGFYKLCPWLRTVDGVRSVDRFLAY